MKISVYGSAAGEITDDTKERAREVGREIARRGHDLLTGACPGLSYEAVCGANEIGGKVLGFSPASSLLEHKERFDFPYEEFSQIIWSPQSFPINLENETHKLACLKMRNIYSVAYSDAAIIIGGRWGTVNEFTLMYDMGKNIGVLKGTGGFTEYVERMVTDLKKSRGSKIVYNGDPVGLVRELERVTL
ncbi:MAG: hypothetical protein ABIB79_05490 [archaeon]